MTNTTNEQDTTEFFGGTTPAAKFDTIGDKVGGKVMAKEIRDQTDLDTGTVVTWPDGRPKKMAVVTLQVAQPTEEDDGLRNLYVRGYMQRAITDAVRDAKLKDLPNGSWLEVTFSGEDKPARKGVNGARRYEAEVVADASQRVPF